MVSQHCQCTEWQRNAHVKLVSFMLCQFYLYYQRIAWLKRYKKLIKKITRDYLQFCGKRSNRYSDFVRLFLGRLKQSVIGRKLCLKINQSWFENMSLYMHAILLLL